MSSTKKQSRSKRLLYTLRHKVAFLRIEKKLTGSISWKGFMHDSDKLWMYLTTNMSASQVHKVHRKTSSHHDNDVVKTRPDYIEMIIDWECARFTKPDKPLNAVEVMNKYYSHLSPKLVPLLKELNLLKDE